MATSHIIRDAERGSGAPWAAELIEHSLLPSGAPHLKELLEVWHQQQPGRSARLRPSPSGSSGVPTAGDVRLQLRRQLLEELHHRRRSALQLSIIQQIIQQKASCRALYSVPSSNHAPPELYSTLQLIQLYTALYKDCILYSYTAYTVYSAIQSPSVWAQTLTQVEARALLAKLRSDTNMTDELAKKQGLLQDIIDKKA